MPKLATTHRTGKHLWENRNAQVFVRHKQWKSCQRSTRKENPNRKSFAQPNSAVEAQRSTLAIRGARKICCSSFFLHPSEHLILLARAVMSEEGGVHKTDYCPGILEREQ